MQRKLSVHVYVGAFIISLLIFLIGIYVGYALDSTNIAGLTDEVSSVSEKVAAVQLLLLSEPNSSSFCPIYSSELDKLDQQIEKIGYKLTYLEDERNIYDDELKKKYFILEAESYLLSKKVKFLCSDNRTLLIHFYSNKNCGQICKDQGISVLQARDQLAGEGIEVKLFSFDGELGSPIAEALETEYNITKYPTLVVNGKTYSGFQSVDKIKTTIKASE